MTLWSRILVNSLHSFSLNSANQHFPVQVDMMFHRKRCGEITKLYSIKPRNKVAEDVRCLAEGWPWTEGGGDTGPSTSCHLALVCKTPDINWVVSIHPCKSPFHFSFSGPQKHGLHGPHQPSSFHWVQPMGGNLRRFESSSISMLPPPRPQVGRGCAPLPKSSLPIRWLSAGEPLLLSLRAWLLLFVSLNSIHTFVSSPFIKLSSIILFKSAICFLLGPRAI